MPTQANNKTIRLENIFLHVTQSCNLSCSYCYFSAGRAMPNEMKTSDFASLWSDVVNLRPRKVIFTGGEPLLRKDIFQLLSSLKDADQQHVLKACLNTNGFFINKDIAQLLVGLVDEVRISLDAMQRKNDDLRGERSFNVAVNALEQLYFAGFEPIVLITVTSHSLPDLEELLSFLYRKNITRIHINQFRAIGRGKVLAQMNVEANDVSAAIRNAWKRNFPNKDFPLNKASSKTSLNCGIGKYLNIMPNGDVYPCHALMDKAFLCGNVLEQSLTTICQHDKFLGRLSNIDFPQLSQQHQSLETLAKKPTCMGQVYSETKHLPVWKHCLPNRESSS